MGIKTRPHEYQRRDIRLPLKTTTEKGKRLYMQRYMRQWRRENPNYRTQLRMGVKVEMEHTRSKTVASKIARDHLSEIGDYYTRLNKMERQAKREGVMRK
jgi:predicted deacetylase